jgi:hypothetical protein
MQFKATAWCVRLLFIPFCNFNSLIDNHFIRTECHFNVACNRKKQWAIRVERQIYLSHCKKYFDFSTDFHKVFPIIKFNRNLLSGNQADICGQKDRLMVEQAGMMKVIGDFHNCAEALRKVTHFYA